tara:strand:- start:1964 stop:2767 length:804 start_codon:yes stop_codon:yes gene_type:complete
MKVLIISGSHPRHFYYANRIIANTNVVGAVLQKREDILPRPPKDCSEKVAKLFNLHFQNRQNTESEYFADSKKINFHNCFETTLGELSTKNTVNYVKKINPDVVFIFGCGMIREPLFSALPALKINLHLGISPRYRGSATLFWPFYFLEPNWAGSTFHIISPEPDAGDIIHHSVPKLEVDDKIHDVACKVVKKSADDVIKIIKILENGNDLTLHKQKGTGKKFLNSDFSPNHLRVNYELFDDDIVNKYLIGELSPKEPKLILIGDNK